MAFSSPFPAAGSHGVWPQIRVRSRLRAACVWKHLGLDVCIGRGLGYLEPPQGEESYLQSAILHGFARQNRLRAGSLLHRSAIRHAAATLPFVLGNPGPSTLPAATTLPFVLVDFGLSALRGVCPRPDIPEFRFNSGWPPRAWHGCSWRIRTCWPREHDCHEPRISCSAWVNPSVPCSSARCLRVVPWSSACDDKPASTRGVCCHTFEIC